MTLPANKLTLVFLVFWPVGKFEAEKFGFEALRAMGVDVEVFDLTRIFHPAQLAKYGPASSSESWIHVFDSLSNFRRRVRTLPPDTVFVDFLAGLSDYGFGVARVFRALGRRPYIVVHGGAIPIHDQASAAAPSSGFLCRWKARLRPAKAWNAFQRRLTRQARKRGWLPQPYLTFGTRATSALVTKQGLGLERFVETHAFDYDRCLIFDRTASHAPPAKKYAVFLDEAATDHADYGLIGVTGPDPDLYFAEMNRLFDVLESRTEIPVEVCLHPNSRYGATLPFGTRAMHQGDTLARVAGAEFVIVHCSTSVNFAVYFRKPILVAKPRAMTGLHNDPAIEATAAAIGTEPVRLTDPGALDRLDCDYRRWRQDRMDDYESRYIKSRSFPRATTWEIVAHVLSTKLGIVLTRDPLG